MRHNKSVGELPDVEYLRFGRFRIRHKTSTMRVHDVMLKCVGFIGEIAHRTPSGIEGDLCGSGFLVTMNGTFGPHYYFVTAKHLIGDLNRKDLYILINKFHGGIVSVECSEPWWEHPFDPTADVAVMPFPYDTRMYCATLDLSTFATPELLRKHNLGPGDEVFSIGLFSYAPGEKENMPIVRYGNVAMMPSQQIETSLGFTDAYLIEARSIGGISGSPVFIRQTLNLPVHMPESGDVQMSGVGGCFCLGLMHGHWDVKESDINNTRAPHDPRRGVNMGIAIVVPASKIIETLNRTELVASRKQADDDFLRSHTPSMD